jgi:hypothetical protein
MGSAEAVFIERPENRQKAATILKILMNLIVFIMLSFQKPSIKQCEYSSPTFK